jgi:cobalamin biosynthesis protein CobW
MVVLNKTDLVDEDVLTAVRTAISAIVRPATKMVPAVHGRLDPSVVLGLDARAEDDLDARPSHHDGDDDHDHDDFVSFIATLPPIADPAVLEARIRTISEVHDVLRVKGFVDVPGKAMRHVVQAVGDRVQRYYDRPWRAGEERRSELVVIGQKGLDQAAIHAALMGQELPAPVETV